MYPVATSATRLPAMTSRPRPMFFGSVRRETSVCAVRDEPTASTEPGATELGAMADPWPDDGAGEATVPPWFAEAAGNPASWTPSVLIALVTGWKNVVPPVLQSPLPPDVTPSAIPSENNGPPLSPGSAHTEVSMSPVTVPSG